MKRIVKSVVIALVLLSVFTLAFTACNTDVKSGYTVVFVANGKEIGSVTTNGNEVIEPPDAPVLDGYEFKGWYLDRWQWQKPFDGNNFADVSLTADVTVYAYYVKITEPVPEEYDVKFYADGTLVDTIRSAGNETLTLPTAPEKKDYEFKGWYFDENVWEQPFTADHYADKALTADVKVYAKYDYVEPTEPVPEKYGITFYIDGVPRTTLQTAGFETLTLPIAPEKKDYEFKGWYFDENVWEQPFTADHYADKALTADVNVYAKYDYVEPTEPVPEKYGITFYIDGVPRTTLQTAGFETLTLPTAPEKKDYEFKGWYFDENVWEQPFTADHYADKALTADVNVYAKYDYIEPTEPVPEKYGITFYIDGVPRTTLQTAGFETLEMPTAPTKVNFEFVGWYFDENVWEQPFTADHYADKALTQDVRVYAKYVPVGYEINFDTDGGSEIAPRTVVVLETAPTTVKAGYLFVGWYSDPEKNHEVGFPYYPTEDCTLYAKWSIDDSIFLLDSSNKIRGLKQTPADGKIYVPEYVLGVKVAGIATEAFKGNTKLVSVEFDPAITGYGIRMFQNCTSLKEVIIPDTATSIPTQAFDYCISLESIELPSSITTISSSAFKMSGLKSITLPDSVIFVGEEAFSGCKNLTTVDLGKVREMQQGVFKGCVQLASVEFPDTLQAFDSNNTFYGCTNLSEVIYPDIPLPLTYTFVTGSAYYKDASNWEDGALYVGNHLVTVDSTFAKTSFAVRKGTVTVGKLAFYETRNSATKLLVVTLPDGLKAIGERAFSYCDALADVNIPDSVIRIYENAFPSSAIGSDGYIGKWLIRYNLTGTEVTVKDGTVGIADGKLTGAQESVTGVRLPSTLRYIGANNFYFMTSLTSIEIPTSLVAVWDYAFQSCSALQTLDFKGCGDLQIIGEWAFTSCTSLNEIFVPESVSRIGESAFNYFTGTLYVQIGQDEIPVGWHPKWKTTFGNAVNVVWNAQA